MERLRIKLPGEGFDLRLVDDVRPTGEALTDKEIVKKEPLVGILRVGLNHDSPTLVPIQA